eukprot:TRINITY_DN166_c0_g1_i5.p1 TRINITY_DN166_c0_g1~~TRINITY_DN166_c0_g1_i5.p1  ORF type:complete len:318 (-),score=66.69 TRINITY_DN166_c0_g1_i5:1167-2120(-)
MNLRTNHAIMLVALLVMLVQCGRAQTLNFQPVIAQEQPDFWHGQAEAPAAGPVEVYGQKPCEGEGGAEGGEEGGEKGGEGGEAEGGEEGEGCDCEDGEEGEEGEESEEEAQCEGGPCFDEEELRSFEIAECFFDSGLAVFYLMRAALEINAASLVKNDEPYYGEELGAEIAGTIGSFAEASSYLAAIAVTCPTEMINEVETVCATAVSELIGGTANMIQGGIGIDLGCVKAKEDNKKEAPPVGEEVRRLQGFVNTTGAASRLQQRPWRHLRGETPRRLVEEAAGYGHAEAEGAGGETAGEAEEFSESARLACRSSPP